MMTEPRSGSPVVFVPQFETWGGFDALVTHLYRVYIKNDDKNRRNSIYCDITEFFSKTPPIKPI